MDQANNNDFDSQVDKDEDLQNLTAEEIQKRINGLEQKATSTVGGVGIIGESSLLTQQ